MPITPRQKCEASKVPAGTTPPDTASACRDEFWWYFYKFIGLAMTALLISLGAPFWFDLLNKLVNLRAAGKPPEPSTPEKPQAK